MLGSDHPNIFVGPVTPLTGEQQERASKIVADYLTWNPSTGPVPFSTSSIWFKRVCAMAERIARLESEQS